MTICEFKGGCTLAPLYEKRADLVHKKTNLCIQITEGPDDLGFVEKKMAEVEKINNDIGNLDMQIGAQIVCSKCNWK